MKKPLLLFFTFIIFSSCASGQAFEEINEIDSDNKIIIVPIRPFIEALGIENKYIKEPILIENTQVIQDITSEWGQKQSAQSGFPIYKVILIEGNEILRTVSINQDFSTLFTGHGYYNFDKSSLFKHEASFIKSDWINLTFPELSDARILIEELQKSCFFYWEPISPKSNGFLAKSGEIRLIRKRDLSIDEEIESYEKLINEDFDSEFNLMATKEVGDSIELTIWTPDAFKNELTNTYRTLEKWNQFKNIQIELTGCKKEEVQEIIKDNDLEAKF